MKINIASKNPVKVNALKETIRDYPLLREAKVVSFLVSSGVSEQPKSFIETIKGAKNRAKKAYNDCHYSFGIESGLIKVPESNSGYMDFCACAVFNGKEIYLGFSSFWEVPKRILRYLMEGINMSDASIEAGITSKKEIGSKEGLIGILSEGKIDRKEYTKEAIRAALIGFNNHE